MKTTSKIIAGVAATLSLAVAGAVYAHQGFGMGPGMGYMGAGPGAGPGMGHGMRGMGPGMGHGMRGMAPGAAGHDMAAVATARMTELKAQLKITPAQETAWQNYEALVAKQAGSMQAMRDQFHTQLQGQQPGAAPPDFAAHRQAMIALRESNQAAHGAALKDLYAVLTPEQRPIADRYLNFMGAQRTPGRSPAR